MAAERKLYEDRVSDGWYYSTIWVEMYPALSNTYQLSTIDLYIFLHIISSWDSSRAEYHNFQPYNKSIEETANIFGISSMQVSKSFRVLQDYNLIIKVEKGKGRARTKYKPNIEVIINMMEKYMRAKNTNDKIHKCKKKKYA